MRPFGTDRVVVDGERLLLSTRRPKGWKPRVAKTLTSAEFPGTAVLWEDEYYEVVEETPLGNTGAVRYVLMRWADEHAIRVADRYDEESERARLEEHQAAVRHVRQRNGALIFGVLLGNFPAIVQLHLASALGVNAATMTLISTIPSLLAFLGVGYSIIGGVLDNSSRMPLALMFVAFGWFAESVFRAFIAWTQSRPVGSLFGIFGYILYYYVFAKDRTRIPSPFDAPKGLSLFKTDAPPDIALRDALQTRSAIFTLLSADEQRRLAERYGYNYRDGSVAIAVIILLGALCGIVSSFTKLQQHGTVSLMLSFLLAVYLTLEQIVRLLSFRSGPAGSVLAFAVRPFARKFLG